MASSLYDSYKQQLAKTGVTGGNYYSNRSGSGFTPIVDTRTPVLNSLNRDITKAENAANMSGVRLQKSDEASNARSAFAAGKASGQKKLFQGRTSGAFGAIGRLDTANLQAATDTQNNVTDLESLSPQYIAARNAKLNASIPKATVGAPIQLW